MLARTRYLVTLAALSFGAIPMVASNASDGANALPPTAEKVFDVVNEEFPGVVDTRSIETTEDDDGVEVEGEGDSPEGFSIPADPSEVIEGLDDTTQISLPDARPSNDSAVVDSSVLHTEIYSSTSVVVTPTSSSSLEIYYLMRDSLAPTSFDTDVLIAEDSNFKQVRPDRVDVVNADGQITLTIEARGPGTRAAARSRSS